MRETDIVVLNITRGSTVISNPKESRVLEGGDRLLCYGKLDSMRGLVPERTRRKRKVTAQKLDGQIENLDSA